MCCMATSSKKALMRLVVSTRRSPIVSGKWLDASEARSCGLVDVMGGAAAELHRIMEESKAMPMTMSGNVDKDFATMMTTHHKTAIKMIDVLQQNGKASDLKALGAKMKANQQVEIKKMEPFTQ